MPRSNTPRLSILGEGTRPWNCRVFPAGVPPLDPAWAGITIPEWDTETGRFFCCHNEIIIAPEFTGAGTVTLGMALIDRAAGIWIPIGSFAGVASGVEVAANTHGLEVYVRLEAIVAPVTDLVIRMRPGAWRF